MKRSDPQMKIRLPSEVKAWIASEAARNRRTQNAQLVVCIEAEMLRQMPSEPAAGDA